MSQTIATFIAKIEADSTGLKKGLDDADKGLDGLAKKSQSTGGALGGLTGKLTGMINPATLAASAATGLAVYLGNAAKAAAESAQVDAKLAAVLKATGYAAGLTAGEVDGMAGSLSRLTGTDDEVIKSGAAVLATFREIGGDVFPQAMQAALDMSAVMGQDLQSSIVQVGKALNDPIQGVTALRRVGVQLTDQQQEQIKGFIAVGDVASAQAVILNELNMEFGGAAESMNEAGDGSENLKVAFGNLTEAIGAGLLPEIREAKKETASWLETLTASIELSNRQRVALQHVAAAHGMNADQLARARATSEEFNQQVLAEVDAFYKADDAIDGWQVALRAANAAQEDVKASVMDFNGEMDRLNSILGGALGEAQDDYNEKIAEYSRLLGEARTQKEKDEINANILEETNAYNERAKAIIFNIQQEAILNSQIPNESKIGIITALGQAYGLYDEATAQAVTRTQTWIDMVAAGTLSEEAAILMLGNLGKSYQELDDPLKHAAARSNDTAAAFGGLGSSAEDLAEKLNPAAGAVSAVTSQLNRMPPSGTAWDYFFRINVQGRVPGVPIAPANPGGDPNPIALASGGKIPFGHGAFVGDGPGGMITPYTEYITPDGYVLNAAETRKMIMAGLIDPRKARKLAGGGSWKPAIEIGEPIIVGPSPSRPPRRGSKPGVPGVPISGPGPAPEPDEELAVVGVANQVTASIQQSIVGALVPTQQIAVSASIQNNTTLKEIRNLLNQLVSKTPDAGDIANAASVNASRNS